MKKRNEYRAKLFRTFRKNRTAVIGMVVICIVLPISIFAPWISPYNPIKQDVGDLLKSPSIEHLLGTDSYGRDILSRILMGSRVSIFVALTSVVLAMIIGVPFGLISGFYGGKIDVIITRFIDIIMSFPTLLMGLMILAVLGPGLANVIISIAISYSPRFARMSRGPAISIKQQDYIVAGRALGMSNTRIICHHLLPNTMGDIIVMGTLWIAAAIRLEANLSFIGIGIQPPAPSLGGMIRDGINYLTDAPWISISGGLAILIIVLAFNMIGDGIRDVADPKLRQ